MRHKRFSFEKVQGICKRKVQLPFSGGDQARVD